MYGPRNTTEYPGLGGLDEPWDAADNQNMFLGMVPVDPVTPRNLVPNNQVDANFLPTNQVDHIVQPSFHRRALVNYFLSENLSNYAPERLAARRLWNSELLFAGGPGTIEASEQQIARRTILRPLPFDHPNFPRLGGEGATDPDHLIHGPWDVDNDGDGVADSIWVDLGYPAMKAADGRLYRPMFAILCLDLDGRLNMNAHGSRDELRPEPMGAQRIRLAGNINASNLPKGQGYGPPEISLKPLFNNGPYVPLLEGVNDLLGRYGFGGRPGTLNRWNYRAQMRLSDYPIQYDQLTNSRRGFLSPPDLKGRFPMGVDFQGQPEYSLFSNVPLTPLVTGPNVHGDEETMAMGSAYDFDLISDSPRDAIVSATDAAFMVGELERLLRPFDADTEILPDRLERLLQQSGLSQNRIRELASRSDHGQHRSPGAGRNPACPCPRRSRESWNSQQSGADAWCRQRPGLEARAWRQPHAGGIVDGPAD